MEGIGGRGTAAPLPHQRNPPPPDRFLGISRFQSSAPAPPLELSEHDIFNTPSGSSSPSSSHCSSPNPTRGIQSHTRGHHGILAALNDPSLKSRSGSDSRPVFNHKASTSASLSSSSSTSPASSVRSATMMIPKRPPPSTAATPAERTRFQPRSAPVNIPMMPAPLARRARELEDIVSEEEEEEEMNGVVLPPHEVVASRNTPMLACSVLEGAGRTLKGRDLRQVRNAIWRRTGFLD
ncbi:hypothetical protein PHJA_002732700 [Phtheirospermum japonicum]|uniref:Senescence regulator n=1 Tax=Phtheirospermum japonicum TaxID=374723 RepID=A0A830D2K8_9LAMI|nr:hypothetical protein PHJA_002732700 [Phtheirospermum japonicum]